MALTAPAENALYSYLTGAMDANARRSFEDRLVADPDLFETLAAYEDELILAYVRGELGGEKRRQFETAYRASPARWRRVEDTRSLVRALGPRRQTFAAAFSAFFASQKLLTRAALATAAALCIAWATLATVQVFRLRGQLAHKVSSAVAAPAQLAMIYEPPAEVPRDLTGAPPHLHIAGYAWVILRIESPMTTTFAAYKAVLRPLEGVEQDNAGALDVSKTATGTKIDIALPARELSNGDYIITVLGMAPNAEWRDVAARSFHVDR